jgi:hypothetical protein
MGIEHCKRSHTARESISCMALRGAWVSDRTITSCERHRGKDHACMYPRGGLSPGQPFRSLLQHWNHFSVKPGIPFQSFLKSAPAAGHRPGGNSQDVRPIPDRESIPRLMVLRPPAL